MIIHRIAYQDDNHVVTGCGATVLVTREQSLRSADLTLFRSSATCAPCNEETAFPPEAREAFRETLSEDLQFRTVNNALTVNEVAEKVAMLFHEHYEQLAPRFSYTSVKGTHMAWDDLTEDDRNLMVDAVKSLLRDSRVPLAVISPVRFTVDDI